MNGNVFIDTNVWVYLYAKTPAEKYQKAREVVEAAFEKILISTQVLGELYHVLVRKQYASSAEAQQIIFELVATFPVVAIGADLVLKAVELQQSLSFSYWDSLIIATAVLNDCDQLYSEDMNSGQVVEGRTTIVSPFSS
jgi:predicted nucleic acid-binding protein